MATRKEFCDVIYDAWKNHSMYIGTGNGEYVEQLTVGQIKQMEINYGYDKATTNRNIRRDFAFIGKCYEQGYDMSKAIAADCSGLEVYAIRLLGIKKPSFDYNCKSFQEAAEVIELDKLQPGDLLFNKKMTYDESKKKYKSDASHMATYIGNPDWVVESKGRDEGVVKRHLKETNFVIGGRLDWFDGETIPVLTRNLKYVEGNLMRGEDVGMCQERLVYHKCDPGAVDGIFGLRTRDAVTDFQYRYNLEHSKDKLEVDGIVGQSTWAKLWEN